MSLVKITETDTGFLLDPNDYLDRLPSLRSQLPSGAWSFASDPDHYDFYSERCIKDLWLVGITFPEGIGASSLTIRMRHGSRAPESLVIDYLRVSHFSMTTYSGVGGVENVDGMSHRLGPVQLDEITPTGSGCEHEIFMIGGRINVTAADLKAVWVKSG